MRTSDAEGLYLIHSYTDKHTGTVKETERQVQKVSDRETISVTERGSFI